MTRTRQVTTRLSVRITTTQFGILSQIKRHTGLNVSEQIRRAITKWIVTAPEQLPLELKAPITRLDIETKIQLIKDIRWIYHKAREAQNAIQELQYQKYNERYYLPEHATKTLKKLETELLHRITEFNQWLQENTTNEP